MDSQKVKALIKKNSPFLDEESQVFKELVVFFGDENKIDVDTSDLSQFLGRKRLFRVIRLQGNSYKDCVYKLIDDYPESMDALGMLRYYKTPKGLIKWEDVEAAEIAIGKELTTNPYGWMPDAWTLFQNNDSSHYELTAILAFDYGD